MWQLLGRLEDDRRREKTLGGTKRKDHERHSPDGGHGHLHARNPVLSHRRQVYHNACRLALHLLRSGTHGLLSKKRHGEKARDALIAVRISPRNAHDLIPFAVRNCIIPRRFGDGRRWEMNLNLHLWSSPNLRGKIARFQNGNGFYCCICSNCHFIILRIDSICAGGRPICRKSTEKAVSQMSPSGR